MLFNCILIIQKWHSCAFPFIRSSENEYRPTIEDSHHSQFYAILTLVCAFRVVVCIRFSMYIPNTKYTPMCVCVYACTNVFKRMWLVPFCLFVYSFPSKLSRCVNMCLCVCMATVSMFSEFTSRKRQTKKKAQ